MAKKKIYKGNEVKVVKIIEGTPYEIILEKVGMIYGYPEYRPKKNDQVRENK